MKDKKYYDKVNNNKFRYILEYHKDKLALPIFLGIFSLIFILLSTWTSIKDFNFIKSAEKTTATVINIEREKYLDTMQDGGRGTEIRAYVKFYIDNKEYSGRLNIGTAFMKTGSEVSIYYNKDNPNEFMTPLWFLYIIMYLCAIIPLIIGIAFLKKNIKKVDKEFLEFNKIRGQ